MNGLLILGPNNEYEIFDYNLGLGVYPIEYELSINTDLSEDFESLTSTTGDLGESIDFIMDLTDNQNLLDFYDACKSQMLGLIQNAEYVTFNFDIDKIAEYVKENPALKNKKILFRQVVDLDSKVVEEIESAFGDDTDNICFSIPGNSDIISFKDYKDTVKILDEMVQEIEKFNFSPLEKMMYAYDLVRDRLYVEVDEDDDKFKSRDLTSVLLGDKIVCVGYASILKALFDKLGIESRFVLLEGIGEANGHARIEAYVKDEKYGVEGVYYFDPTWDSKKDENDTSYLQSYRFFAVTKEVIDSFDAGKCYDSRFPYFSPNMMLEFKKIVEEKGFEALPPEMIRSINHMSNLVNDDILIYLAGLKKGAPESIKPNKDKIARELEPLVERFNTPLSAETYLEVLMLEKISIILIHKNIQ